VLVRQQARHVSQLLGFDDREQTSVATAISEIARNAVSYAGGGTIEFELDRSIQPESLLIRISDSGPGIQELEAVLEGRHRPQTKKGMGIIGAQRLTDDLQIDSTPGRGTTVRLRKFLPRKANALSPKQLSDLAEQLRIAANPFEEIKQQSQELLRTLEELRRQQQELTQLNRELEDTNRGVVALYSELDDKTIHLKQADEIKSRFLSNMSHEFRTPLNSILALARLLLDRMDGDLTAEQVKQVAFISKSAEDLLGLVNDLLDLAKVKAGKLTVHPTTFEMKEVLGALRGVLKPLLTNDKVTLVIEDPAGMPPLHTDESKVSQILRNLVSNALKFTESGEIRLTTHMASDETAIILSVSDTGIGIAPEHQALIFQEFSQLDNPLQKKVRGTGLGLPLTKKLTELLGGSISVKSVLGVGSTFSVQLPLRYPESPADLPQANNDQAAPVLVLDTSTATSPVLERFSKVSGFEIVAARSLDEVRRLSNKVRPRALIFEMLPGVDGAHVLAGLKAAPSLLNLPMLVLTETPEDEMRARALGADGCCMKTAAPEQLAKALNRLIHQPKKQILVIDDEEISRYVLKGLLTGRDYQVLEASGGEQGLLAACESQPQAIFLDLIMPDPDGYEVLKRLAANPATRDIPIAVITSKALTQQEFQTLSQRARAVLSKSILADEQNGARLDEALVKLGVDKSSRQLDVLVQ
jgi:signal transduction histidine kinase/CheY-like chemotaxis protein